MRRSSAPTLLEGACLHSGTNGKGRYLHPLDRRPLGRAGVAHRGHGPPLCMAGEIGIFVRVSDDDAGVVIRFVLAQRGTRVLDLVQRGGSRSPCGPQNIQPTSGNRISRKRISAM